MSKKVTCVQPRAFHVSDADYSRYSESTIVKNLAEGKLTQVDAQLIKNFISEIKATNGIGASRANKIISHLVRWRSFVGPYKDNTIYDLYTGIEAFKTVKQDNGFNYEQNTIRDFITFLKRFYQWLIDNQHSSIDKEKIQKIRPPSRNTMTKTAEDILTEDEIRMMLDACQTSRDRALIAVMCEGALRAIEMGTLTWRQVKFTDWSVSLNVNEKTGKPRLVPLIMARQYLATWKADYPNAITDDGPVFLTHEKNPMTYHTISTQFKKIAKRAGITKKITPHLFRHSRITHMIQQDFNESVIKKMCWGNLNTMMFSTYAHLTDQDIEREIATKAGIETSHISKRTKALDSRQCMRCSQINPPTNDFCGVCGLSLTEEVEADISMLTRLIENEDIFKRLVEQVKSEMLKDPLS